MSYGPEFGYTLSSGRLFCDFARFQEWTSRIVGRPLMTHDFATVEIWDEMRAAYEEEILANARVAREDRAAEVRLRGEERVVELERKANK